MTNLSKLLNFATESKPSSMEPHETAREMMTQMLHTRMAFRQSLQRALKSRDVGISFEMLQIISTLSKEQGLSQQTLAERCAKDKACMTNLMGNMEKKGWITRRYDASDRRSRLVYLTREGEKMNQSIRPMIDDIYSQITLRISPEAIRTLTGLLKEVDEILDSL